MIDTYEEDTAVGQGWEMWLGDANVRMTSMDDHSVDLSVHSPPFASLYSYSASPRDMGNSASREEFHEHYGYTIAELLRVTKPGRMACVHVADIATTKATHGVAGLYDLPGDVIRGYVAAGWVFAGRVWVDLDPQAVAQRTKAHHLLFVTKQRDSTKLAPAAGDQLLIFRAPGENAVPLPHTADEPPPGVSNEDWIAWARPVWLDINRTRTLNARVAREDADERHLHPLQLDFIERCTRLYSAPGELVFSPCAGVGSEVYQAVKLGRRGLGIELKRSYWETAVRHLRALQDEQATPTLFDTADSDTDAATDTAGVGS